MKKETTKKSKRVSKAQKQKQKLIITGGLAIIVVILAIILGVFVFGSCGIDYTETDTNTVFVLKDGRIVSTDIEEFNEATYDKDKLQAYVKDVIDTYNKENGKDSLKQKSYAVVENVATLVLEYANTDIYESVNGVELFNGTMEDAKKAGYDFDATYAKLVDGKAITATADEFLNSADYKVVVIKSNTKVVIPGEVCFVSTKNVSKVGEDFVLIKENCELLAEDVEFNTEFGTEAEGSDGSIGEGEVEGGDGEIIFDFGDEPNEESSQYSEVLTYIIYK